MERLSADKKDPKITRPNPSLEEIRIFYDKISGQRGDIKHNLLKTYFEEQVFPKFNDSHLLLLRDDILVHFSETPNDPLHEYDKEFQRYLGNFIQIELTMRDNAARNESEKEFIGRDMTDISLPDDERRQISSLPVVGKRIDFEKRGSELIRKQMQAVNWENLVFVRSVDISPWTQNGKMLLKRRDEEGKLNTIHWTLNHKVASHPDGSWAGKKYNLIVPAQSLVAENGPPLVLNHVDTFWDKNLTLPEGSLILSRCERDAFNIPDDVVAKYHFVSFENNFSSEYQVLIASIQKMGYSYLTGSMWADPDIQNWLRELREKYHMGSMHHKDYKNDPEIIDKIKQSQALLKK